MIALIDADVLVYEIGFAAETGWQSEGLPPFDYVVELLDRRIEEICNAVGCTDSPQLYLTGQGNFREQIAVTKPYKGTRKGNKPYHYDNLRGHLQVAYQAEVVEGIEADDVMSIIGYANDNTIICTRDKDLRMVPCWHYGWELGHQPEYGPKKVEPLGSLYYNDKKKLKGEGYLFFMSQMITGDSVDNIPGLPRMGEKKAYTVLASCKSEAEALERVRRLYEKTYREDWEAQMDEQGALLWMLRKHFPDGVWSYQKDIGGMLG